MIGSDPIGSGSPPSWVCERDTPLVALPPALPELTDRVPTACPHVAQPSASGASVSLTHSGRLKVASVAFQAPPSARRTSVHSTIRHTRIAHRACRTTGSV